MDRYQALRLAQKVLYSLFPSDSWMFLAKASLIDHWKDTGLVLRLCTGACDGQGLSRISETCKVGAGKGGSGVRVCPGHFCF